MNSQRASILMVISAVLWGTNPSLIQLADWTPFGTAWLRGLFCFGVLLIYVIYKKSFSIKSIKLQFLCAIFLVFNSALFVSASLYTSPANAVLLLFIFPWITLLLDFIFRGLKPSTSDLFRLALGFMGIVLIVWGGLSRTGTLGNILSLLAGTCIAFNIFFTQKLERIHKGSKEVLSSMLLVWLITIIALAPLALINESLHTTPLSHQQWWYLILFGLCSAIPYLLYAKAIAYIPGHVVGAILGVEVFSAAVFGWLLIDELPPVETWVGGALTLIAAIWQISPRKSQAVA